MICGDVGLGHCRPRRRGRRRSAMIIRGAAWPLFKPPTKCFGSLKSRRAKRPWMINWLASSTAVRIAVIGAYPRATAYTRRSRHNRRGHAAVGPFNGLVAGRAAQGWPWQSPRGPWRCSTRRDAQRHGAYNECSAPGVVRRVVPGVHAAPSRRASRRPAAVDATDGWPRRPEPARNQLSLITAGFCRRDLPRGWAGPLDQRFRPFLPPPRAATRGGDQLFAALYASCTDGPASSPRGGHPRRDHRAARGLSGHLGARAGDLPGSQPLPRLCLAGHARADHRLLPPPPGPEAGWPVRDHRHRHRRPGRRRRPRPAVRPERGARRARGGRPAAGAHRRPQVLLRLLVRRDRLDARPLGAHRAARLGEGPNLPAPGAAR